MKIRRHVVVYILTCVLVLMPIVTPNNIGIKSRPGWVSVKIIFGFIRTANISDTVIIFNATIGTFYMTFQPFTIKRYHRNEQIIVGVDSIRLGIILKHFVFIIATAISPPPYTSCILDGNEIIPL